MTAATMLSDLEARGIRFFLDGDQLHLDAPVGALTPQLRADLAAPKPELLAHLRHQEVNAHPITIPMPADELEEAIRYATHIDELSELVLLIPEGLAVRLIDIATRTAQQLEQGFVNVPAEVFRQHAAG